MFPAYLSAVSLALLLVGALIASAPFQKFQRKFLSGRNAQGKLDQAEDIDTTKGRGGPIIIAYDVVRLLGCFAATGLSIASLLSARSANGGGAPPVMYAQIAQCSSMVRSHVSLCI